MKIGIPRESLSGETRVACTPATVALLGKLGFETVVESGAGLAASLDDAAYQTAGATVADKATVWACPLIYKVNAPSEGELPLLNEGQTIVSFLWPRQNEALVEALRAKKVNALAMDMVPRISRAQALDALSSMANISGYRAVIEAANAFGRFFTGQITAAGKVPPAQVLVIGAVVAVADVPAVARCTRLLGLDEVLCEFHGSSCARHPGDQRSAGKWRTNRCRQVWCRTSVKDGEKAEVAVRGKGARWAAPRTAYESRASRKCRRAACAGGRSCAAPQRTRVQATGSACRR